MKKFSDYIVNHCYIIFGIFLIITAICGVLATKVKINKDIYSYMPDNSETSLGLEIMNEEFDYSATSSYQMMLTDVPAEKKENIKSEIEAVEGVRSVDYDTSDKYNRDQYTRYIINVDAPADSEVANRVYQTVHDKYAETYEIAESGQVFAYNGEVLQIHVALLAVGFAMVILTAMSESWVEPWLFLFAIMLAVVVNKGTNIIFPSVSHVTDSIAAILQMALSMDYAIMLSTRYRQEKAKMDCPDKQTAMRRAMRYSFGAISSSSVTTVVGLLVLIFMSFTIGRDMGLVLSKGVVLSLVSIFTSLPALLMLFDKAIGKTAKKTLNLKMDWFGRTSFNFRKVALPAFLLIFVGCFLLKGSTAIDFTANQNDKIKDVFERTNQLALIYDAEMDDDITKICNEFDQRGDTTRVLCYGNTINEPKKYQELVPKVNEISSEAIETEDYLIKVLYYHYFKDVDAHQIALDDFVKFLQNEVFPNEHFAREISGEIVEKVNRFANFTDSTKVHQLRTKQEIAGILGVDARKLDEVYILYLSKQNLTTQMTLHQFAQFVNDEILTNPSYAKLVTEKQRSDLAKLLILSDAKVTDTPKSTAELAKIFGISQETLDKLLVYYNYTTIETPTVRASAEELVNFALSNQTVANELGLTAQETAELKDGVADLKKQLTELEKNTDALEADMEKRVAQVIASLPTELQAGATKQAKQLQADLAKRVAVAKQIATQKYSYAEVAGTAKKADEAVDKMVKWLSSLENTYPEAFAALGEAEKTEVYTASKQAVTQIEAGRKKLNLEQRLAQLKSIYRLYQAGQTAGSTKISPRNLVNFLLSHTNDEQLKTQLSQGTVAQLKTAQYVMNNQATKYSAEKLAQSFSLDADKAKLVYALYTYRHVNQNPRLSLWTLVSFIDQEILPNGEYASRLDAGQRTQLATVAQLMRATAAGYTYNYETLYRAILPLANNVDKNQLFLAYLYHGSLYDYDEDWALTIETFVDFLDSKVVPDSRFAARIDDDMRQNIADGRQKIMDAKDLIVGPKHYRALIESKLPAEGEQTFALIRDLKEAVGSGNKTRYFVIGDSAMAYEMSQTFDGEMNYITVLTMLAIFAVVVCTFKSFFVSLLLVFVIQCAVYIVMAYLSLTGSSIYFIALIIVQSILMGATIDYAILFTSYYVENRTYFKLSIKDALISTYNRSINAILTSASILIIVTAIVGNMATAIAATICSSISLGTFCATIIILGLLPALLATLDRFIVSTKS